jgi:DNA mismatch repair protein MutS
VDAAGLSLLFDGDAATFPQTSPRTLVDLNLDQVIAHLFPEPHQDSLRSAFRTPLPNAATVAARLDIFADLDDVALHAELTAFCRTLSAVRTRITSAEEAAESYVWHARAWTAAAMAAYIDAVRRLTRRLHELQLHADALVRLRDYLALYSSTPAFASFAKETDAVLGGMSAVKFGLRIEGERVSVGPAIGGADFASEVRQTLAPFLADQPEAAPPLRDAWSLTQFETRVVWRVVQRDPAPFAALARHCAAHDAFLDPTLAQIAQEAEFFLAVRRLTDQLASEGLPCCYPELVESDQGIVVRDAYDVALALRLGAAVVRNDLSTSEAERQLVVTGANQGGKTTFARMMGQIHHLASIGLPVPAARAVVRLTDQVHTHFEQVEVLADAEGRLVDDLHRLDHILCTATPDSVVVLNELFSSTSHADARDLGRRVLRRLSDLGALTVYVTFVDELAEDGPGTVSLVAQVEDDDAPRRTFRVLRKPANGAAYADALARHHGLGYAQVIDRLSR